MGIPVKPVIEVELPSFSSQGSDSANLTESISCSLERMWTANDSALRITGAAELALLIEIITTGGSSEIDENAETVMPTASALCCEVTMVTPLAKRRMALRRLSALTGVKTSFWVAPSFFIVKDTERGETREVLQMSLIDDVAFEERE